MRDDGCGMDVNADLMCEGGTSKIEGFEELERV